MMKRYLVYIGKQYHTDPDIEIVYKNKSTGEILEDTELKIGIHRTDDGELSRFNELGRTKAPIGWTPLDVFEAVNEKEMFSVETSFKNMWDKDRIKSNGNTEYYRNYYGEKYPLAVKEILHRGLKSVKNEFPEWFESVDQGAKEVRKDADKKVRLDELKSKIHDYLEGESFTIQRKKAGFDQTITIKKDGFHSDTNDQTYTKENSRGTLNWAFEDSFRQKIMKDYNLNPDNDSHYWYDESGEWFVGGHREKLTERLAFWNSKDKNGKTVLTRLREVDNERKVA